MRMKHEGTREERLKAAQKAWRDRQALKRRSSVEVQIDLTIQRNLKIVFEDQNFDLASRVRREGPYSDAQVNEHRRQLCATMGWPFRPAREVWRAG